MSQDAPKISPAKTASAEIPPAKIPPPWTMPADLMTIVADDGEWEDPSWDPVLLSVVGDTLFQGRLIPLAWQVSLWPDDVFFGDWNEAARDKGDKCDGLGWAARLLQAIEARAPALHAHVHDESDRATCVLWVETEAHGRVLVETVWLYLHEIAAHHP